MFLTWRRAVTISSRSGEPAQDGSMQAGRPHPASWPLRKIETSGVRALRLHGSRVGRFGLFGAELGSAVPGQNAS